MRKQFLDMVRAVFMITTGWLAQVFPVYSQQDIIVNKDNTRPETTRQLSVPASVTAIKVIKYNGYNEIQWGTFGEQDTRRFIVEYTTDGSNFQTAGELAPHAGFYQLKHYTSDNRAKVYRIRIEEKDGSFYSTDVAFLDGVREGLVIIHPTNVRGDVINVIASLPAERATIVGMEGQNIFSKELGGVTGSFTMAIPTLKRGVYWITFYGRKWNNTIPFLVAD